MQDMVVLLLDLYVPFFQVLIVVMILVGSTATRQFTRFLNGDNNNGSASEHTTRTATTASTPDLDTISPLTPIYGQQRALRTWIQYHL
jgi:hypothetical protein